MADIEEIVLGASRKSLAFRPLILCLYTGPGLPNRCAPMLRDLQPEVGLAVDASFADRLTAAVRLNHAIHDGAVMIGRAAAEAPYRIMGWSFRLFPEPSKALPEPNRGSAFNSCLAMSSVDTIDALYLASSHGVLKFRQGTWTNLAGPS